MYFTAFGQENHLELYVFFEIVFLLDFLMTFFVELPCSNLEVCGVDKQFEMIFLNYFYGNMLRDIIPLIPFPMIKLPKER